MPAGWETWYNNKQYTMMCHFHKNNLTWREALYETAKDIRARTNKNLVLCLSGGADSMLVYNVFKDLNIEVKTIHQRYWTKDLCPLMEGWKTPGLINEYESRHVDPDIVDIFQDINVDDFLKTEWYKKTWAEYCPVPWYTALQTYIKFALDSKNDFIIGAWDALGHDDLDWFTRFNEEDNIIEFASVGDGLIWTIGFEGYDYTGVFNDNPIITYCRYKNTPKEIMANTNKKLFLEYHFPEFNHLLKFKQRHWPRFIDVVKKYEKQLNPQWVIFNTAFAPVDRLDVFIEHLEASHPIVGIKDWFNPEKIKIFSDETRYINSNTIPSENL